MDSFGFIEHLKLPHYVTFQSILDRIRAIRERQGVTDGNRTGSTTSDSTQQSVAEVGNDD
jgi:alpha-D-ribose 1-methylphosphonate 5-triphosphate synthase subunit PhnI